MEEYSVRVSFEKIDINNLVEKLQETLDLSLEIDVQKFHFGLLFRVIDNTGGYEGVKEFLEENDLENDLNWPENLDFAAFGVELEIDAYSEMLGFSYADVICDVLARQLSISLETRAIVSINDNGVPLIIYDKGEVLFKFPEEHRRFFDKRSWLPAFLF